MSDWQPDVLYMDESTGETFYSPDTEEQVWFASPMDARAQVGDWKIMMGDYRPDEREL